MAPRPLREDVACRLTSSACAACTRVLTTSVAEEKGERREGGWRREKLVKNKMLVHTYKAAGTGISQLLTYDPRFYSYCNAFRRTMHSLFSPVLVITAVVLVSRFGYLREQSGFG